MKFMYLVRIETSRGECGRRQTVARIPSALGDGTGCSACFEAIYQNNFYIFLAEKATENERVENDRKKNN